jgi:chitodextrinase
LWAIEAAPLYSGDDLTQLDSYGLSLLTNSEVIAVDQAGNPAKPVSQHTSQQVWYARNSDGSYTVALFNLDSAPAAVTANWSDLGITGPAAVRDLWSHSNLGDFAWSFGASLPAHGSRLLRITPVDIPANNPSTPANLHGTASTPSSISLAWDPSQDIGQAPVGYTVSVNGATAMSVSQPSATVTGLAPGTTYTFTITATRQGGGQTAQSAALMLTTPAAGGPTTYEAESSANTIGGSAAIYGCSGCSGGAKVGYLGGGSGYLTFNGVQARVAGTYLMQLSYVDGDSSRTGVVTVNGTSFDLSLPGTNDNNWDTTQTVTVPVQLNAGSNTIEFSSPTDWVYDVDKIAL